ncbi:MAG: hypothetical protein HY013_15520 [Candidatus Solibacter usitatus]|nr:hypothetical protein [Candidatus Solibacter usitatus]
MAKGLRSGKRYLVDRAWIRVSWLNREGALRVADAKVVDISEKGIALDFPEAISTFSILKLRSAVHSLEGSAVVRHCRQAGIKCRVGLEMQGSLGWAPPPEPAPARITLSGQTAHS